MEQHPPVVERRRRRRRRRRATQIARVVTPLLSRLPPLLLLSIASRRTATTRTTTAVVDAQYLVPPDYVSPTESTACWLPCKLNPNSNVAVPFTQCKTFYVCRDGRVTNRLACSGGRAFDERIGACNHEGLVNCVDPTCPPSVSPTEVPTMFPTESPSRSPTVSPTNSPTTSPTVSPTTSPSVSPTESPTPAPSILINHINSKRSLIEKHILKSYTNDGATAYPSIRYTFDPFVRSLQTMGVDGFGGDDIPHRFLLWDTDPVHYRYGLANVAAFLAQAAVEAIYDDTCDELNWQQVAGRYAVSNSCGQEGRSYQDETCGKYSCLVDPAMEVTAIHAANDVRAPPPFECRPRVGVDDFAGYWDTNSGSEVRNTPYSNTAGRIDVEGCCYWGRGALLTRGSCNIGKLNYYLGARAAREGRPSLYPDVDFCADPEATCASGATEELRWTTAMFEWSERVQRYNSTGWDYKTELYKFLDGGMTDDSFIDTVSKAFVLGCHTTKCSKNQVRHADDRKSMFFLIVNEIFVLDSIPKLVPTSRPTRRVIPRPQTGSTPQQQQQQQPPSSVSNPTDLTPQPVEIPILSPQKPNLPPSGSTATPNRPQFVTPMPVVYVPNGQPTGNVNMPNTQPSLPNRQPPASNPGSEQQQQQQHANTYWPTYSENIIPLEGNGAGHRLSVCFFGIAIAGAIHLVFIP